MTQVAAHHRSVSLFTAAIVFIVGFSLGAISERLGWLTDENAALAEYLLDRSVELDQETIRRVLTDDALAFGRGDVNVTTFTDYECPFCARWDSIATSSDELAVHYRNYPLGIHPTAKRKHQFVECVRLLAGNNSAKRAAETAFTLPKTADWPIASALAQANVNYDPQAVETCVTGPGQDFERIRSLLTRDSTAGALLGISGTPTHVVGSQRLSGAIPVPVLRKILSEIDT